MQDMLTTSRRDLVGLLGLGAVAGFTPANAVAQAMRRVNFMFGFSSLSNIVSNQTSVPRHLGLFSRESLEVEHHVSSGGSPLALQLVSRRSMDIGSGSFEPALQRAAANEDMGLIFFYNQIRRDNTSVVVQTNSPINTLSDLAGRSIGVASLGSAPQRTLSYALAEAGVDVARTVRFINVGIGGRALQTLRSGQVDAYVAAIGTIATMEMAGETFKFIPMPAWADEVIGPGLFTSRTYLRENRRALVGIGRAVARATVFVLSNPEAAVRIHWRVYPEQVPQGQSFDLALERAMIGIRRQIENLGFQERDRVRKFGYMEAAAIDRLLRIHGVRDAIRDSSLHFTNDLIDEVNEFDAQEMVELARNFRLG